MITYQTILDKYKLQKGNQYIIEIPGIDSINLAELFCELGYRVGAEIGVDRGEYSEILAKSNPEAKIYCIDPWITSTYERGAYLSNTPQPYFNECYEETKNRLAPYNCTIIKDTSELALNKFDDESLDFVYIDANHDFPNFTFDLHHWLKKVKKGGIISGHDFTYFSYKKFNHVRRCLEAYARCYRMIPLFVCGITNQNTRLKRDHFRSWFWVKS